jgi:ribulose-phosphate 3-epimerase
MRARLKASTSLWSADLANLEDEIKRAEPYSDLFHIDVCDGQYAPTLLFFPDLVAAIHERTVLPLEVHLITRAPEMWVGPFADAGADRLIFYPDVVEDPEAILSAIADRGVEAGVSLAIQHSPELLVPYLKHLSVAVILGTDFGIKGVKDVAPGTYEKIRETVMVREASKTAFEIEADGAIRRETVPRLREAGVDIVVPGSLMFNENMAEVRAWMHSLP